MQIYLDYSATTPPRLEAIAAMHTAMTEAWGNPSSLHTWGDRAALVIERARLQVATLLNLPMNVPSESIVFTSGGTEANNLAIMGIAQQYRMPRHMIISAVEHAAIAEPLRLLESRGWSVTRLPVNRQGQVNPADLSATLRDDTVLVSVIYGQSEVGTLQPIAELGQILRQHGACFHTDAVQVAGRLPLAVDQLAVDLLSLSSHKLYGPQGVGALYVRPDLELMPLLLGGGQEAQLRSGTQAVPNIAGFGVAAALAAQELPLEMPRLTSLRDRLFRQLQEIPELVPTGDLSQRLPNHLSFCLPHADGSNLSGKTLVRQMNLAGIAISAGAACQSGKLTASPVLTAMGYCDRIAKTGIRITLGHQTTTADIDWTALVLKQILQRLLSEHLISH